MKVARVSTALVGLLEPVRRYRALNRVAKHHLFRFFFFFVLRKRRSGREEKEEERRSACEERRSECGAGEHEQRYQFEELKIKPNMFGCA